MLPLLQFAADGHERELRDAYAQVSQVLGLNDDDRAELLPSGQQLTYKNRLGWAKTHLTKAGLLESVGRARFRITPKGKGVVETCPPRVDMLYLNQFPEYVAFREQGRQPTLGGRLNQSVKSTEVELETPDEAMERIYQNLRSQLVQDALDAVRSVSPAAFERLVVELLVRMGYGGTAQDAGRAIGRSGDGGIDGIIKRDRLGLENIYVQAKRWQANVGSPEVRNFYGGLQQQKANKGIIITTSGFTPDAHAAARDLGSIVLVGGDQLATLIIDFNVGVSTTVKYDLKRLDRDFFDEL